MWWTRVLSWTNAKSYWGFHTHMRITYQSTSHMCIPIISSAFPFIECGHASWLGVLEWDFAQIWLDVVLLMLLWDSKPPSFPHPHCPRCNHWPKTHQPCHFSNFWPFGNIWDAIGPPRGVWCQFGNFGIFAHNWIPKPLESLMMYL